MLVSVHGLVNVPGVTNDQLLPINIIIPTWESGVTDRRIQTDSSEYNARTPSDGRSCSER